MPANAELQVEGLVKRYSATSAVGPFTFDVRQGEFFSILGPSGCGKTTLLRCISGFESVTAGSILLGGRDIAHVPPNRRDIGLVFQNYALFPHLDVTENVAFGLRLRRLPGDEIARRVTAALATVGLEGLEDRWPRQLSGGQQQRVAIARALVLEPGLMLFDEPLSSLDLKLRQQMRAELRDLQRRLGMTTLYVTHDQTEALAMSDRIAVLSPAGIEQIGTAEEIYARPQSLFVAQFIGASNVLEGEMGAHDGDHAVLTMAGGHRLVMRHEGAPAGKAVAIVRPERIRLLPRNAPTGQNHHDGRIRSIVYLGQDLELTLDVPWAAPFQVALKSSLPGCDGVPIEVGARLRIAIAPDDIHRVNRPVNHRVAG